MDLDETKVLTDRIADLEREIERVDNKYCRLHAENRKRVKANRMLMYVFGTFATAAITGVSYQSGELQYSFDGGTIQTIVTAITALGLGGGVAAIAAKQDGEAGGDGSSPEDEPME